LWHHAAKGDLVAIKIDLKTGLDPTAPDKDGFSSLHVAAQNGHADVVPLLLEAGADPNATDRHGNGPLWTACYEGMKAVATVAQLSIITMLLRGGANPDETNKAGRSPQYWREVSPEVDARFTSAGF
jgi:ankyrin repeat protein